MRKDHLPPHAPERRRIEGAGTTEAEWRHSAIADLPALDIGTWIERYERIWLVAPHPDDEILGLGGCLAALSARHARLHIVSVSDGEASHQMSATWTAARLAETRPAELRRSLDLLGIDAEVTRLRLPDGRVEAHRQALLRALATDVGENDLILATCSFDGHPDHEACGSVAAVAAELTGATLIEYPVWMWHWAAPDDAMIPWERASRIPLSPQTVEAKRIAIDAFVSQTSPDGTRDAVLPPHVVARFLRDFEIVFADS